MKEISILKSRLAAAFTALAASLLVLVCMPVSCSSSDDGPSGEKNVTVTYETELETPPAQISLTKGKEKLKRKETTNDTSESEKIS